MLLPLLKNLNFQITFPTLKASLDQRQVLYLCGGGGDANYDVNQLLWDLEPTSIAKPPNADGSDPGPLKITDPNLQTFTAASDAHLYHTPLGEGGINTVTAYAMGIKFEPVEPGPEPKAAEPTAWT